MKKLIVFLLAMMIASDTNAIVDPTPNTIGFYWDDEASVVEGVFYSPFMTGHLIITTPTFATFKAVEMELAVLSSAHHTRLPFGGILGTIPESMGQVVSIGSLPSIVYSTAIPVVTSEVFKIYTLLFQTPEQGLDPRYVCEFSSFYLNPLSVAPPTIEGALIVLPAAGEEFIQLAPIVPLGTPCTILTPDIFFCSTPSEKTSWSTLKSLYR